MVNPFGGNGRGARALAYVTKTLEEAKVRPRRDRYSRWHSACRVQIECVVLKTERAKHATDLVRERPLDGIDAVVVIGGDGCGRGATRVGAAR